MNMIPLVRATEQGRAHFVNRKLRFVNCSLEKCHQCGPRPKSFWKKASKRVRIPFWLEVRAYGVLSESRVLWNWCAKWEVIFF